MKTNKTILLLLLLSIFAGQAASLFGEVPKAIYLTWQKNPESTMTINWITEPESQNDSISFHKNGDSTWQNAKGTPSTLPSEDPKLLLHRIELTSLEPSTGYTFKISDEGQEYKFRTMPKQGEELIRFVVGGDMYHKDCLDLLEETNRAAAKTSPHFALVGGDIAYAASKYANGKDDVDRWLEWLAAWQKYMVTPEGNLIPLIPTIGNHDVNGRYRQTPKQAPFFYALFPMPGSQGYNTLDFSGYLTIFILDSEHTHLVKGKQTQWLKNALEGRKQVPHKFALYHVAAYPSVRPYNAEVSSLIRRWWVPLFDQYGLDAVFEHHDHAYKRSHLLKNNKIDPKGILFLGDGGWSVREPRVPKEAWYLAKTAAARHFILVTIEGAKRSYTAIDYQGNVIDTFTQNGE